MLLMELAQDRKGVVILALPGFGHSDIVPNSFGGCPDFRAVAMDLDVFISLLQGFRCLAHGGKILDLPRAKPVFPGD